VASKLLYIAGWVAECIVTLQTRQPAVIVPIADWWPEYIVPLQWVASTYCTIADQMGIHYEVILKLGLWCECEWLIYHLGFIFLGDSESEELVLWLVY